ncbi:hypothetical protein GSUB_17700 (plasmid) [Geoalkalibacter subterraneus]|uniref:Uncharacterized protein n=1 Tax=Geoalkalibacter subterraneus TaxID=483547 RepID=A0A0B5FXJ1_9BACT|nr:hypothetical protein GSUB_17700 [Geoalkalibacter subterraneus]
MAQRLEPGLWKKFFTVFFARQRWIEARKNFEYSMADVTPTRERVKTPETGSEKTKMPISVPAAGLICHQADDSAAGLFARTNSREMGSHL